MKKYIGVKMIEAEPMTNVGFQLEKGTAQDGVGPVLPGYKVRYADGYESWCPDKIFKAAYYGLEDESGEVLGHDDVIGFVGQGGIVSSKLGQKTCVVQAKALTGFEVTSTAACVEPDNYDQDEGTKIALGHIKDELWGHLGFVLQWARFGLKR